jgi:hypothetical protein
MMAGEHLYFNANTPTFLDPQRPSLYPVPLIARTSSCDSLVLDLPRPATMLVVDLELGRAVRINADAFDPERYAVIKSISLRANFSPTAS